MLMCLSPLVTSRPKLWPKPPAGRASHGVRMLPLLVRAIHEGRATANPQLKVLRERAATCLLDGDNGRPLCVGAGDAARGRARQQFGLAFAWRRGSRIGARPRLCLPCRASWHDRLCTTNAIPNMLAWGSTRPLLGNNPLAIGIPRGPGQDLSCWIWL